MTTLKIGHNKIMITATIINVVQILFPKEFSNIPNQVRTMSTGIYHQVNANLKRYRSIPTKTAITVDITNIAKRESPIQSSLVNII
jgi:hypothetical protein